jgi:beta-galactosidase
MQRLDFDRGWRFHLGAGLGWIHSGALEDGDWRRVDLPHDWSIELDRSADAPTGNDGGYFPTGVGWYQKRFEAPDAETILIEFEGVYMNAEVWLDEHHLGRHPYGYTAFRYDLTPYLGGEHLVRVLVDNSCQRNSRWYSGSGIYRHVWLWTGGRVRVEPWDVCVTNEHVRTVVTSDLGRDCEVVVRSRVGDREVEDRVTVPARGSVTLEQPLPLESPERWAPETPTLYTLETQVLVDGALADTATTTFGVRTLAFDAESGFRLNGRPLELRGGCVHHDHGPLGAASHDRAEERKVELLKANGFNAVRCAHNPPAPAFLDACDRLGLLVIDEAFDCWRNGKHVADYHVVFDDWWRRDLDAMLLRDRNHPSVIMWSIGNEPVERARPEGARIARMLADHVRSVDPTRPVTAGINGGHGHWEWAELDDLFATLDVCGYNYAAAQYPARRTRIVYGSESVAASAFDHWRSVGELSHVIGDFVWTACDYLGEAGIGRAHAEDEPAPLLATYPWHVANCGDLDLCGFKRPQSHYRDVLWSRRGPFIVVHDPAGLDRVSYWGWPDVWPSWTWPGHEGRPLRVDVYSAEDRVELFLDDTLLGIQPTGRCVATFEVPYRPGCLRAGDCELRTVGEPAAVRLTPDRTVLGDDDLCFVAVEVVDAEGSLHPGAGHTISFHVDGPAAIAAVGSGDPAGTEPFRGSRRSVYRGRGLVVLRTDGDRGAVRLRGEADGLAAAETELQVA